MYKFTHLHVVSKSVFPYIYTNISPTKIKTPCTPLMSPHQQMLLFCLLLKNSIVMELIISNELTDGVLFSIFMIKICTLVLFQSCMKNGSKSRFCLLVFLCTAVRCAFTVFSRLVNISNKCLPVYHHWHAFLQPRH